MNAIGNVGRLLGMPKEHPLFNGIYNRCCHQGVYVSQVTLYTREVQGKFIGTFHCAVEPGDFQYFINDGSQKVKPNILDN